MIRASRVLRLGAVAAPSKPWTTTDPAGKKYLHKVTSEVDTEADLGARNEAAYFDYKAFQPADTLNKYALHSTNNLLTSIFVEVANLFGISVGVGLALWAVYCSQKYETVVLARPAGREE